MDKRKVLNIRRFYRNPEVKKITVKFIIILLVGIITIFSASSFIVKRVNRLMINQNAIILSNILEEKDTISVIKDFYKISNKEEVQRANELLKSYGYGENMSMASNEIGTYIGKEILTVFIPMGVLYLVILYLLFLKELRGIYIKMDEIVTKTGGVSSGKYKRIEGDFNEGEMAVLISSLNYMGDRVNNSIELLKAEKEYLKDFLSDISHQLKTPLASLIMFNDLLKENENMPYEDRIKFLDKCEEQLERMEWLIMNLLKVGRLEAGAVNFEKEYEPLRDTIDMAVSSLIQKVKKKNQQLIIYGDLDIAVSHDRHWLAEAISNILKNAIEHTPYEGKIEIGVERGALITKINIVDNGKGMSEEIQQKVFKRFYKGENSVDPKSIGIGLSLSKSIIEKQGGEIKLRSKEGEGTTFVISFIDSLKE